MLTLISKSNKNIFKNKAFYLHLLSFSFSLILIPDHLLSLSFDPCIQKMMTLFNSNFSLYPSSYLSDGKLVLCVLGFHTVNQLDL